MHIRSDTPQLVLAPAAVRPASTCTPSPSWKAIAATSSIVASAIGAGAIVVTRAMVDCDVASSIVACAPIVADGDRCRGRGGSECSPGIAAVGARQTGDGGKVPLRLSHPLALKTA